MQLMHWGKISLTEMSRAGAALLYGDFQIVLLEKSLRFVSWIKVSMAKKLAVNPVAVGVVSKQCSSKSGSCRLRLGMFHLGTQEVSE